MFKIKKIKQKQIDTTYKKSNSKPYTFRIMCFVTALCLILSGISFANTFSTQKKLDNAIYLLNNESCDTTSSIIYKLTDDDIARIGSNVQSELVSYIHNKVNDASLTLAKDNENFLSDLSANIQNQLKVLSTDNNEYVTKEQISNILDGSVEEISVNYNIDDTTKNEILSIAMSASSADLKNLESRITSLSKDVADISSDLLGTSSQLSAVKASSDDALSISQLNSEEITALKTAVANIQEENINILTSLHTSVTTLNKTDLTTAQGVASAQEDIKELASLIESNKQSITDNTNDALNALIIKLESSLGVLSSALAGSNSSLTDQINSLMRDVTDNLISLEKQEQKNYLDLDSLLSSLTDKVNNLELSSENSISDLSSQIKDLTAEIDRLYAADEISSEKYKELLASVNALREYTENELKELSEALRETEQILSDTDSSIQIQIENNYNELSAGISGLNSKLEAFQENILDTVCNAIYPVGSIYISVSSTNPGDIFGGTWEAYGKGTALVGVDPANSTYSQSGLTGGSSVASLTADNIPSHSHSLSTTVQPSGSVSTTVSIAAGGSHSHTLTPSGTVSVNNVSLTGNLGNYVLEHSSGTDTSVVASGVFSSFASSTHSQEIKSGYYTAYTSDDDLKKHHDLVKMDASHTHSATFSGTSGTTSANGSHSHTATALSTLQMAKLSITANTSATGNGTAFSVMNPYTTVYMWKRIK